MSETHPPLPTHAAPSSDDFERRLGRTLPWAVPLVFGAAAIVVGVVYDLGTAILVLAGGALLGTIAFFWASLRTLSGDAPLSLDEAVALGTRAANEEQKRTVLQALKDLEYEFSVGKIGEDDYRELRARYRAEAKRLLRAMDQSLEPERARAEAYIAARLSGASDAAVVQPARAAARACASCSAANDDDARFCKHCGAPLGDGGKERAHG